MLMWDVLYWSAYMYELLLSVMMKPELTLNLSPVVWGFKVFDSVPYDCILILNKYTLFPGCLYIRKYRIIDNDITVIRPASAVFKDIWKSLNSVYYKRKVSKKYSQWTLTKFTTWSFRLMIPHWQPNVSLTRWKFRRWKIGE